MKPKFTFLVSLIVLFSCGQQTPQYEVLDDRLKITVEEGELNLVPLSNNAIRVELVGEAAKEEEELVLINQKPFSDFEFTESGGKLQISTASMTASYDLSRGAIDFLDAEGNVFLSEVPGSRKMMPDSVMGEPCYFAEQSFDSPEDEYIFGLGQFQDGHYNLRNVTRKLIQVNSQIAIPVIYSSRGYGLLWHQYGLTEFNPSDDEISLIKKSDTEDSEEVQVTTTAGTQSVSRRQSLYTGTFNVKESGSYTMMMDMGNMETHHLLVIDDTIRIDQTNLWLPPAASTIVDLTEGEHTVQIVCGSGNTPKLTWKPVENETTFRSIHAKSLDYVVFRGEDADEAIASYRDLSGDAPMLPKWAFGFWQCRERYSSSEELVSTVKEFRDRELPMDVIVQDWQYWKGDEWGVPQLDESRYPDPSGFIQDIHDMNAHFAISIWSNPDKNSELGQWYQERGLFIPDTKWLDYFNPETSDSYWKTLNDNLFKHGVDAWWMDATEPENDALTGTMTHKGPGDFYRLTYPMYVSKSVYEGQRATDPSKRVAILTRSAFAGQQRYGAINWSGDVGWDWDAYQRQIVAGLNYAVTGMPYWTTDIGGFFRPGQSQYTDPGFHELLTRWFQWGAFSPIFRMHGYQTETELWKYGDTVVENARIMLNLRYRLMPYIYSEAWKVNSKGSTMMRPLVMDFVGDKTAISQRYEYMFGESFLVTPVTQPGATSVSVYLPQASGWYDFWTGSFTKGGTSVDADASLDKLPLFVKAGSIVPMGEPVQYAAASTHEKLEIRIYEGADGYFELYEDEGDNYSYEDGNYKVVHFTWDEQTKTLTIHASEGDYSEGPSTQEFKVVWINGSGTSERTITYSGEEMQVEKN